MHDSYLLIDWGSMAAQLPVLLVVLGGFCMAYLRWKQQPRTSLLASLSLALFLTSVATPRILWVWLGGRTVTSAADAVWIRRMITLAGLGTNLGTAVALGLLLWACFAVGTPRPLDDARGR